MNPDRSISRRTALIASGILVVSTVLGGCTEPQDEEGLAKEKRKMTPTPTPNPLLTSDRPFHNKVIEMLKVGNKIGVWDGEYLIGPGPARRFEPFVPEIERCENLLGDGYWCRPGEDYRPFLRSEIVHSPLYINGIKETQFLGKFYKSPVEGMAYFSPYHGKVVWVAVIGNDTAEMIRRNGVLLTNLRPSTQDSIRQIVTLERVEADKDDPLNRPKIWVKRSDENTEQILESSTTRILGLL